LLAEKNIQVVHRVPDSGGIGRLAKASGGTAVSTLDDLTPEDLGRAAVAEEIRAPRFDTKRLESEPVKSRDGHAVSEEDKLFVIDGCESPRSVTVFLRADVESMLDESERALDASIATCEAIVKEPRIVGGAGSVEAELARRMREFAYTFDDKTQVIVLWYAEALEGLVEALASNAGIDPIDAVLKIRAAHAGGGEIWTGIDLSKKRLSNAIEMGVVEPMLIKKSALKIATEAAIQIIKIDRILAGDSRPKLMPGEMPWGASEGPTVLTDAKDLPDETVKAFRKSRYLKPYGSKQELNL
jgi:chaperonin GroEL (HSP60 family)